MDNVKISIVIPAYNAEKYLEDCVNSIIQQTYKNIEIIIVNDGSIDDTLVICRKLSKSDNRIIIVNKKNGGPTSARKRGLNCASGEYIIFVDADDWVDINMCKKLLAYALKETADMVVSGLIRQYEDGTTDCIVHEKKGLYLGKEIAECIIDLNEFFNINIAYSWAILYKRDIILEVFKILDERIDFAEDYVGFVIGMLDSNVVYITDECFYYYRKHKDSYCHKHFTNHYESQKLLYKLLYKQFKLRACNDKMYKQLDWMVIRNLLIGSYNAFLNKEFLFPFEGVKKYSKIVIYGGAGVFGSELYYAIRDKNLYTVVARIDQQWKYYKEYGEDIKPVEEILNLVFDYIVIAITKINVALHVKSDLEALGISKNKIKCISQDLIVHDIIPKDITDISL